MGTFHLDRSGAVWDMPHAAYPIACRAHYYAEVGPDVSSWSPFSKHLPICAFGIVFVRSDVCL